MDGANPLQTMRSMMQLQVVRRGSRIQKTEGARGFRLELREFGAPD